VIFRWRDRPELSVELLGLMSKIKDKKDIVVAFQARHPELELRKNQIMQRMYDLHDHAHGKASDQFVADAEKGRIKAEAKAKGLKRTNEALLKSATDIESLIASVEAAGRECEKLVQRAQPLPKIATGGRKRSAAILLSDAHATEVVRADVTRDINEFNMDILACRMWALQSKVKAWIRDARARWDIEKLYVCIIGDMHSGVIHDLQETNECDPGFGIVWTGSLLGQFIGGLSEDVEIEVREVPGNHGRFSAKPKYKVPKATLDWLIGAFAHAQLEQRIKVGRVAWNRHNGWFDDFVVYNRRYVITHGDQVKGTFGIPHYGIRRLISAIREQQALLDDRERARGETLESVSVYQVLGAHFHQPSTSLDMIINGTLKGVDEYSTHEAMKPVPAIQIGFLIDPEFGTCGTELFDVSNSPDAHGFCLPNV
jgi:hypothetical protein